MNTKTIKLNNDVKYYEPVVSLELEYTKVQNVLTSLFDKFMNEHNSKVLEYCREVLEDYRYVPNDNTIPEGYYVRHIDTRNPLKMQLKVGGFVTNDNGYSVKIRGTVKNNFEERSYVYTLNKRRSVIFVKITDNEKMRCLCQELNDD